MEYPSIAFIGGGNMATSLIGGLLADGWPAKQIFASEPDATRGKTLAESYGINVSHNNAQTTANADVIVLAVKPQVMADVAGDIASSAQARKPLIISIAAGVRIVDLQRWLGDQDLAIVRTMPNTPALLRTGATALFANANANSAQRECAETIMRAVGVTAWVKTESALDSVTAISGSGPAYFFLFMEALQEAAEQLGLDAETARILSLQTAFGAAKMALESTDSPAILRQRVTSPGGTTERAIAVFEEQGLRQMVAAAAQAAAARSVELGDILGGTQ